MSDAAVPAAAAAAASAPAAPASAPSSSLDMPLGDLISKNRGGGGKGRRGDGKQKGGRQSAEAALEKAGSGHPLNRDGGDRRGGRDGGSGPIRTERRRDHNRDRAPREPFSREAGRSDGTWSRGPISAPLELRQSETKLIGDTVRLSNLNPDISEEDLRYIFDKIGPIRGIQIHYNAAGKCLGTAEIQFSTNAAAELAVENLDQAEVDGRIMYVNLVGQMIVQASLPLVRRYDRSPPRRERQDRSPRRDYERRDDRRGGGGGDRQRGNGAGQRQGGGRDGGRDGGRGGAGKKDGAAAGAGGKGGKREPKPEAKASDLDADMDSYHAQRAAANAAAASSAAAPAGAAAAPAPAAAME